MTDIRKKYSERYVKALCPSAANLESFLKDLLSEVPRIDSINARPKSIDRFLKKSQKDNNGSPKYDDPLNQIQDQIGARIIVLYKSDVSYVSKKILKYFKPVEVRQVLPESNWEFGYFGYHHILMVTKDFVEAGIDAALVPDFFELQIKTLFQHAWSEANHDLGYKPGEQQLGPDQLRKLAFTSAQAWGADQVFNELFLYQAGSKNDSSS